MSKLDFLKRYNSGIQLIDPVDYYSCSTHIPSEWKSLLMENDEQKRTELLLGLWSGYLGSELSNTISYLKSNLINLDLLENRGTYSLLYSVKSSNGSVLYYEGKQPNVQSANQALLKKWDRISPSIKTFYEKIHDGFYYYASESMGLVPLHSVTHLDEYEWGILDEMNHPLEINLETSFGFFSNGMGGYVVFDCDSGQDDNAVIWWKNDKPDYHVNFWDVVDEWIVIGLED